MILSEEVFEKIGHSFKKYGHYKVFSQLLKAVSIQYSKGHMMGQADRNNGEQRKVIDGGFCPGPNDESGSQI